MRAMGAVWQFVRTGLTGIIAAYVELGDSVAATRQVRLRYRAARPEHLADRMDRAHREGRPR